MNIDRDWIALSGIIVLFQAVTAVTVILLIWCSRDGLGRWFRAASRDEKPYAARVRELDGRSKDGSNTAG